MPRARALHKDTGGIALDAFRGMNTQVHPSKLKPGEMSLSINNSSKWGNCRKEHGWGVVNDADLSASGGAQSRMTTDRALFTGANAGAVTGVIPYRYTTAALAAVQSKRLAFCGRQLYDDVGNASFLPSATAYQIHQWASSPAGDLPVVAEWDGNLFLSIGRETTAGVANGIQVWDGATSTNFSGAGGWADTNIGGGAWVGNDIRPAWMAVNWGYLVCGGYYDATAGVYKHNTIKAVDLNAAGAPTNWMENVLGAGGDKDGSYINGMIAFGDHIFVFTRNSDIIRLSWLSDLNIEGISVGGTIITDRARRISYQNGCAAGHSLVIAGQRLLWLADDGVWMLDNSESLVPTRVSEKLDGPNGVWDTVTKGSLSGACATYDEQLRQVLFSVPYSGSTTNNVVIVAQLPDNDYEANDFRTWDWHLRDRAAASLAYDPGTRTILWGSSVDSGLLCEDAFTTKQAGPTTATNIASTGVSYTVTTLTDTGAAFTPDALIGLPVTIRHAADGDIATAWITDNTATVLTFDALSIIPSANDEYFIGGIHWAAILNEFQFEDKMFFLTGFLKFATSGAAATIYSELYPDNQISPTVQSHAVAIPSTIPVTIPFTVGGSGEIVKKLYSDDRAVSMTIGVREHGYSATPRLLRIDLPVHRITRSRRR